MPRERDLLIEGLDEQMQMIPLDGVMHEAKAEAIGAAPEGA